MRNPFKKRKTEESTNEQGNIHKPTVGVDGKPTILLSVDSQYRITNKTLTPDQLLSITTMLMDYSAKMLSHYSEKYDAIDGKGVIKYQDIMDKMVQSTHIYTLVDAGMDADEAMKIVGIQGHAHEIPKD